MKKSGNNTPLVFQAELVKPRRRLLAAIGDLFFFYIITASLYLLAVYPITRSLPSFKNSYKNQQTYLEDCRKMYLDGHLVYYDNTGSLMSNDTLIHKYVNDKVNKGDFDEEGKYIDPFYYFYLSYANENLKKENVKYNFDISYLKNDVYQLNNQSKPVLWEESSEGVAKLTAISKEYISKYINKDVTAENKAYYDKIVSFYKNAVVEAEKTLLGSDEYKASYSVVMKENQILFYHFTVSSIITYVIFYGLYFLLVPALFKNGQTFVMRILKISFTTREDKPIQFPALLLRSILQMLGYFFIPLLLPYLILGNATFSLPMITIAGLTVDLWLSSVVGIILCIVSFIVCLASQYNQNIYDKIIDVYALDLRNMHINHDNDENVKSEEDLWK